MTAKKSLGQNFLVSERVAGRIVGALGLSPGDPVFEIGPGKGALTLPLAAAGARVTAFEIDRGLAGLLKERLGGKRDVEIVNADIRRVDLDKEAVRRGWERYAVIGNIPYLLTGTILIGLVKLERCRRAVIMVQKEVGERVLASPGGRKCGILSIFMQAYMDISRVTSVAAGSFNPRPKVDSVVLCFEPAGRQGAPAERAAFLSFVKEAFSQRRKKLAGVLKNDPAIGGREGVIRLASIAGVDAGKRPEELLVEEWFRLFAGYAELKRLA